MAETFKKRRKQQKSKTTSRKAGRKASGPTKNEPASGQEDSGNRLRVAIDKEVKARSRSIAKAMVNKTISGNVGVARLLIEVTGAKNPQKPPAEKPGTTTWAQQRASEPPWQGGANPDDDIGCGGREPEV